MGEMGWDVLRGTTISNPPPNKKGVGDFHLKRRDLLLFFLCEGKREFSFCVAVDLLLIIYIIFWLILYKYCTRNINNKQSLSLSIYDSFNYLRSFFVYFFFLSPLFYVLEKRKKGKKMKERRKKF